MEKVELSVTSLLTERFVCWEMWKQQGKASWLDGEAWPWWPTPDKNQMLRISPFNNALSDVRE